MLDLGFVTKQFPALVGVGVLSEGGQKWVFGADHPSDGPVVLKIIKPSSGPELVDREIRAVLEVQSPRVPRILETGTISTALGDFIWVREERVPGRSLRERLGSGALHVHETLCMSLQMLEALAAAESARIVHRDVKPENIMVDAGGGWWLLDFGIARHLAMPSNTSTVARFGRFTAGYAPREQFRNIKPEIDGRADLFALGVTVVESSLGSNLFTAGARDIFDVLSRVEHTDLPRLGLSCADADLFADLVEAMTRKRPDQRPANVAEALAWMREVAAANGL